MDSNGTLTREPDIYDNNSIEVLNAKEILPDSKRQVIVFNVKVGGVRTELFVPYGISSRHDDNVSVIRLLWGGKATIRTTVKNLENGNEKTEQQEFSHQSDVHSNFRKRLQEEIKRNERLSKQLKEKHNLREIKFMYPKN